MLNLLIEMSWNFDTKVKEMSQQDRDKLRANVFAFKELKDPVVDEKYYSSGVYGKVLVTEDEFSFIKEMQLDCEVKNFKHTYASELPSQNGAKYHFHLPNISLIQFDAVQVLEDVCTEKLQEALDEGWRIIAVCPPNGVRRPDYVLGAVRQELRA